MIFRCILIYMKTSPSKNLTPQVKSNTPLLLLGIILILAIGTSILPASWFGIEQQVRRYEPLNLGTLAQPENLATDTNNDGTISWGELIASSLYLSQEKANTTFEVDQKWITILNDPNNITASYTKNAYIASTALGQGGIVDEASKQDVMKQLFTEEIKMAEAKIYTFLDVNLVSDSKTTLKNYGNNVASILKNIITKDTVAQGLFGISGYLQTTDEKYLIPVTSNAKKVNTTLQKLLALQVPKSALPYHVTILNRVSEYANVLSNLSTANTDAMRATIALKKYQEVTASVIRIYPLLSDYFSLKNVTFTSTESGYIYTVGYNGITN